MLKLTSLPLSKCIINKFMMCPPWPPFNAIWLKAQSSLPLSTTRPERLVLAPQGAGGGPPRRCAITRPA